MIIAASVVALLLIAGLATVLVQQKQSADAAASAGPLPSEVVQNYLDAIASGDADTAIGNLAQQPDTTAAMTADVLAASNKTAPITDIEVARTERTARSVKTSYNIGDTTVQTSYQVVPNDGGFRITAGYLIMDVSSLPGGLSYRLNGAELGGDRIALFPGTYTLTTPGDYLSLGQGATFTVKSPTESSTPVVEPAITEAGLKAIREQVSDAVSGCLKSTRLHAGCGLTVGKDGPNGTRAADGTISRTLPGSGRKQLAGLDVWPQPGKPSVARTIGLNTTVDTSAICVREKKVKKKGNKPKTRKIKQGCTLTGTGTSLADVAVDLSKSTPVISWN
ncbi:MAG TPA: hypothetical protein VIP98_24650 [Microlunatus sp.]